MISSAKLTPSSPFENDDNEVDADESEHEDEVPITNLATTRSVSSITVG